MNFSRALTYPFHNIAKVIQHRLHMLTIAIVIFALA